MVFLARVEEYCLEIFLWFQILLQLLANGERIK